jgi:hypothetical protein
VNKYRTPQKPWNIDTFGLEDQLQRIKSTHDTHLHALKLFGSQQSAEYDWSRLLPINVCCGDNDVNTELVEDFLHLAVKEELVEDFLHLAVKEGAEKKRTNQVLCEKAGEAKTSPPASAADTASTASTPEVYPKLERVFNYDKTPDIEKQVWG